jgi:hypothetical protein
VSTSSTRRSAIASSRSRVPLGVAGRPRRSQSSVTGSKPCMSRIVTSHEWRSMSVRIVSSCDAARFS